VVVIIHSWFSPSKIEAVLCSRTTLHPFSVDSETTQAHTKPMNNTHGVKESSYAIHSVPVFQKDLAAVFKLLSDRNPDQDALGGLAAPTVSGLEGTWSEADLVALLGLSKPVH